MAQTDQAAGLRELLRQGNAPGPGTPRARVVAVTSGKGGVGKTNLTVNLALALAERGTRVILFDADLGLANVDVLLGISAEWNLSHVVHRRRSVREIVIEGPLGVRVVPSGSGLREMADLPPGARQAVVESLGELESLADVILVDTGAGLSANVLSFVVAADEAVVVVTPEPTSLLDAYGVVKAYAAERPQGKLRALVNQAASAHDADAVFSRLAAAAQQFLRFPVVKLGWVPRDPLLAQAVLRQRPLLTLYPDSPSARAIRTAAAALSGAPAARDGAGFFRSLAKLLRS